MMEDSLSHRERPFATKSSIIPGGCKVVMLDERGSQRYLCRKNAES